MNVLRRWSTRLLVEAALVVISILVAFALNSWWESRQRDELVTRALDGFVQEIRRNQASLEQVRPYHRRLQEQFGQLAQSGTVKRYADLQQLDGFEGFRPAFLTTTAWQSSLATGALAYIDYDLVAALSALYTLQERFSERSVPEFLGPGAFADANIVSTLISATLYLGDVTAGEEELTALYKQVLNLLEARTEL